MNFNYTQLENKDLAKAYVLLNDNVTDFSWELKDLEEAFINEKNIFLGVFINSHLIGVIHGNFLFDEGEIFSIAISKNWQKQGLGTELIQFFLKEMNRLKVKKIFLEVRESNISAKKLYKKNNFQKISQRKNYYHHPNESAEIYLLEIKS